MIIFEPHHETQEVLEVIKSKVYRIWWLGDGWIGFFAKKKKKVL
jgi:hypothetical protein